ncbi:MBL fold metallo-hydrolase [Halococcus agarilyticus]|uniref:MBL fold metallo-hydrolase n=1 Tax=Halococcus agarilyticus TaxID=1232219 RepID=UPI0006778EC3|nr:MBL fold metallo-hydrolase [Halococcus agarilyticus]
MDLPDHVHALSLDVAFEGREITLHPSAIETERGLLLLDTGLPSTIDQLADRLDAAGFALDDVVTVLVTHQDGDHAGGLSAVVERSGATVVAHEHDAPAIDGREDPGGPPGRERYPPARVDLELGGAATFHTRAGPARVVPTPGHTTGHVSVFLPEERLLIAADALTVDEDGLAGPRPDVTRDVDRALSSVARLADLDIDRTLCYHGGFVKEGTDRIAAIADGSD